MSSTASSSHFINPLMVWTDVALKTGEMLVSSGSVIQARTQRMAAAGLTPSATDLAEFQLMGQEKLDAANESNAALAHELGTRQVALMGHAVQHWIGSVSAFFALVVATTPAEAIERHGEFISAATRSAAVVSHISSAGAHVAHSALKPIHAKATSNARRLAAPLPLSV
ncbi:polyhydroxyalkanoate granule-associated phasin [Variovorax sp. PAMC 28711]|uniref:polyhydroxyalkanoate granule-associated phasin n=1 Tax=Variovorax sp. PAMC 28711 TaxID=1795631 RepID=UPI00078E5952|nr:polyhydroxyalkanoate granule-associated phasin [Variovorax sp. PAMC 28711]AMM24733.1 hypothetical protein AX767_10485 [Variovorax sp. PAMC 28711]